MPGNSARTREDAEIIRRMIQHENEQLNSRFNWLLTLQGLLFASLSFSWEKGPISLSILLGIIGVTVSISSFLAFVLSSRALGELIRWWDKCEKPNDYSGPDIVGLRAYKHPLIWRMRFLYPWSLLPMIFGLAWIVVIYLAINGS